MDSYSFVTELTPQIFRICPGRYVANQSMWIAFASMLATFDFLKARDEHGNEIDFTPQFGPGVTS